MPKRGKRYLEAEKTFDKQQEYPLNEAVSLCPRQIRRWPWDGEVRRNG